MTEDDRIVVTHIVNRVARTLLQVEANALRDVQIESAKIIHCVWEDLVLALTFLNRE
jgi:hypothetical protein